MVNRIYNRIINAFEKHFGPIQNYKFNLFLIMLPCLLFANCIIDAVNKHFAEDDIASFGVAISSVIRPILFVVLWAVSFYLHSIYEYYRFRTRGRNYFIDRHRYNLVLQDLLEVNQDPEPRRIDVVTLPEVNWWNVDGVILGQADNGKRLIYVPTGKEGNYLLFALPGGGKTTSQVITTAMRYGGSVLVIDIKGDVLAQTAEKRNIRLFSLSHPESSLHFNPLHGYCSLSNSRKIQLLKQLANIIVPKERGENSDFWVQNARKLFLWISYYLLSQNPSMSFIELIRTIQDNDVFSWVKEISSGNNKRASKGLTPYIGLNEANVSGCFQHLCELLDDLVDEPLASLFDGKGNCISPQDLEDGYDVYIEVPQDLLKVYSPAITIIVQLFLNAFMRRADRGRGKASRPILFVLDEFPQLQFDFSAIETALSTLRSKGVSVFLACQSISQLISRYGKDNFSTIVDTCKYVSVMSSQAPESCKWFSDLFGTKRIYESSFTVSETGASRSIQARDEPVFRPEAFADLRDDLIVKIGGQYIRGQKTYYFKHSFDVEIDYSETDCDDEAD